MGWEGGGELWGKRGTTLNNLNNKDLKTKQKRERKHLLDHLRKTELQEKELNVRNRLCSWWDLNSGEINKFLALDVFRQPRLCINQLRGAWGYVSPFRNDLPC